MKNLEEQELVFLIQLVQKVVIRKQTERFNRTADFDGGFEGRLLSKLVLAREDLIAEMQGNSAPASRG